MIGGSEDPLMDLQSSTLMASSNGSFDGHTWTSAGLTLTRLCTFFSLHSRTNASLFTIRTYMKPLRVFNGRPELAANFVRAIDALPDDVLAYKDMKSHLPVGRAYLEKCANGDFL